MAPRYLFKMLVLRLLPKCEYTRATILGRLQVGGFKRTVLDLRAKVLQRVGGLELCGRRWQVKCFWLSPWIRMGTEVARE